jgi:hypothetical protein
MPHHASTLYLIAAAALIVDAPAAAQDEAPGKLYAGAGLAVTDLDSDYAGIGYGDTALGLRVYGGFQMKQWLAFEVAFDRHDNIEDEGPGSGLEQLRIAADHSSLTLQGTFSLSLQEVLRRRQPITVFGTLGIARSEERRTVLEVTTSRQTEETEHSTGPVLGVGAIFDLSRVRLRTYVQSLDHGDLSLRSLGVAAEFRF